MQLKSFGAQTNAIAETIARTYGASQLEWAFARNAEPSGARTGMVIASILFHLLGAARREDRLADRAPARRTGGATARAGLGRRTRTRAGGKHCRRRQKSFLKHSPHCVQESVRKLVFALVPPNRGMKLSRALLREFRFI
jgi:hypothetical protein